MRKIFRSSIELFTKDPWRKLGSIALACLLWIYVHQNITGNLTYTLEIRPTRLKSWESDPGFLYVRVPPDRILQLPRLFQEIKVTLEGTHRSLQSLPPQLYAYFDPGEEPREEKGGEQLLKMGLSLDKIRWDPPHVASLIKDYDPDPFFFTFEPIERHTIFLQQERLDIQGAPPEGFQIQRDQIQFHPSSVTLVGPHSSMEKLRQGGFSSLFSPIEIRREDTRSPQTFRLDLHPDLGKEEISLETGESPLALIPVQPKLINISFKARIFPVAIGERADSLNATYRLQGSSKTAKWVEEPWVADIPANLASEITEAWIQNNVLFFVDLGMIPEGPEELESVQLEVSWKLNVQTQDRPRFSQIWFRPADPGRSKIIAEKVSAIPQNGR